jgi:hypothetical protein
VHKTSGLRNPAVVAFQVLTGLVGLLGEAIHNLSGVSAAAVVFAGCPAFLARCAAFRRALASLIAVAAGQP